MTACRCCFRQAPPASTLSATRPPSRLARPVTQCTCRCQAYARTLSRPTTYARPGFGLISAECLHMACHDCDWHRRAPIRPRQLLRGAPHCRRRVRSSPRLARPMSGPATRPWSPRSRRPLQRLPQPRPPQPPPHQQALGLAPQPPPLPPHQQALGWARQQWVVAASPLVLPRPQRRQPLSASLAARVRPKMASRRCRSRCHTGRTGRAQLLRPQRQPLDLVCLRLQAAPRPPLPPPSLLLLGLVRRRLRLQPSPQSLAPQPPLPPHQQALRLVVKPPLLRPHQRDLGLAPQPLLLPLRQQALDLALQLPRSLLRRQLCQLRRRRPLRQWQLRQHLPCRRPPL